MAFVPPDRAAVRRARDTVTANASGARGALLALGVVVAVGAGVLNGADAVHVTRVLDVSAPLASTSDDAAATHVDAAVELTIATSDPAAGDGLDATPIGAAVTDALSNYERLQLVRGLGAVGRDLIACANERLAADAVDAEVVAIAWRRVTFTVGGRPGAAPGR